MKSDLLKLGISSNKTMSVNYPSIPENLQSHFMRGVFDGDGCVSIHHDKRDNSDRGQVNICSGSFEFIKEYVDNMVRYCGVKKNNIRQQKGTYYVIDWGGLSDVESFYEFLYKDANIFLKRKKETYDKVMSINQTKNKYRKLSRKRNMTLRKNLAINNILKKRYQIGCSRKNNIMSGGGVLPFQALNDLANNTQHMFNTAIATTLGTTPEQSPDPTSTT